MNILYFGDDSASSTSFHRASALRRLGYKVEIYSARKELNILSALINKLHYHTGYTLIQAKVLKWLKTIDGNENQIDIIWVNGGEYFGPKTIKYLKKFNCPIILYNNDDPTGGRDGNRFNSLLKAIPFYDLCVVMRNTNISEYYNEGAKSVFRVRMSYDEKIHKPFELTSDISKIFKSEVVFLGTWMRHEKRDEFLLQLIDKGIPVSIWGNRWQKSRYWERLKPYYKGGSLSGRDYVAAIQGAKICLGLLSKGNRDLHTTRSMEIPFAGGLLCAERTTEHLEIYEDGIEAVFWNNVDECAQICKKLLSDAALCENIREAGMRKVRALQLGHEDICKQILKEVKIKS